MNIYKEKIYGVNNIYLSPADDSGSEDPSLTSVFRDKLTDVEKAVQKVVKEEIEKRNSKFNGKQAEAILKKCKEMGLEIKRPTSGNAKQKIGQVLNVGDGEFKDVYALDDSFGTKGKRKPKDQKQEIPQGMYDFGSVGSGPGYGFRQGDEDGHYDWESSREIRETARNVDLTMKKATGAHEFALEAQGKAEQLGIDLEKKASTEYVDSKFGKLRAFIEEAKARDDGQDSKIKNVRERVRDHAGKIGALAVEIAQNRAKNVKSNKSFGKYIQSVGQEADKKISKLKEKIDATGGLGRLIDELGGRTDLTEADIDALKVSYDDLEGKTNNHGERFENLEGNLDDTDRKVEEANRKYADTTREFGNDVGKNADRVSDLEDRMKNYEAGQAVSAVAARMAAGAGRLAWKGVKMAGAGAWKGTKVVGSYTWNKVGSMSRNAKLGLAAGVLVATAVGGGYMFGGSSNEAPKGSDKPNKTVKTATNDVPVMKSIKNLTMLYDGDIGPYRVHLEEGEGRGFITVGRENRKLWFIDSDAERAGAEEYHNNLTGRVKSYLSEDAKNEKKFGFVNGAYRAIRKVAEIRTDREEREFFEGLKEALDKVFKEESK